jgi:hypothetical protein
MRRLVYALVFAAGTSLVGCGPAMPPTAPTKGTVLYRGDPLPNARVVFTPEEGRPAVGTSDAQGRFMLSTFQENDGAVPGRHRVAVMAGDPPEGPPPMPGTPEAAHHQPAGPRLPEKYADPATSGLAFEVKPDVTNEFTLELD